MEFFICEYFHNWNYIRQCWWWWRDFWIWIYLSTVECIANSQNFHKYSLSSNSSKVINNLLFSSFVLVHTFDDCENICVLHTHMRHHHPLPWFLDPEKSIKYWFQLSFHFHNLRECMRKYFDVFFFISNTIFTVLLRIFTST